MEFLWRTCEVGFQYGKNQFVDVGFCCFVGPKLALTATEVADWAIEIGRSRDGSAIIRTRRGMAPFIVRERFDDLGGVALIQMGDIDDSHIERILREHGQEVANAFYEPLQTPVRSRMVPFWGERVGFIHTCEDTKEYRIGIDYQFDSADVAFSLNLKNREDFLNYALTPVMSRIAHRGSPVFTEDGRLVGVIKDSIKIESDAGWRPIVSGVVALSRSK